MKTTLTVDEIANLFNKELQEIETRFCDENHGRQETYEKVKAVIDATCEKLRMFEDAYKYQPDALKSEKIRFQQRTNKIILKSYFATRTRTWPQGHQGDYKTLETLYRNTPLSHGIGYYLDLYAIDSSLAEAVRNRIKILERILSEELRTRMKPNILNIASGSCRELMNVAPDIYQSKAKVTCIDNDSDALNFALNRLSYSPATSNITLRIYNAVRLFDHETNIREFGMEDIIYSVGLFDYLPDDFLIKLLRSLYMLLNVNGKLIVAFKNADFYDSILYHWLIDWDGFKQRDESDFLRILDSAQIPLQDIKTVKDKTNIIVFYVINKVV